MICVSRVGRTIVESETTTDICKRRNRRKTVRIMCTDRIGRKTAEQQIGKCGTRPHAWSNAGSVETETRPNDVQNDACDAMRSKCECHPSGGQFEVHSSPRRIPQPSILRNLDLSSMRLPSLPALCHSRLRGDAGRDMVGVSVVHSSSYCL